jgi:tRNA threonylcarbamoyladenosine biosynthesis protein TsaB
MSSRAPRLAVALETSTARPSLAVRRGERLEEATLTGGRTHASDLLPTLGELLARLGAGPADIAAVVVGTGPGSYTGLRVGVATALGLARGAGAAVRGVPSLEAVAFAELAPGQSAAFLLDARQGELYLARYRREAREVQPLLPPCVTAAAELGGLLVAGERVFADDATLRAAELEAERARAPGGFAQAWPRAAALLTLGVARLEREGGQREDELEPLYLRAFAARTRRR